MKYIMGLLFVLSVASPALALERFDVVTTQELRQILAKRAEGKLDFCLMNTLDTLISEHSSIPGSVNIPMYRIKELAEKRLGPDRDRLIISYCMGFRWVYSYKTAVAVKELGYTNIKIYNGGIKDWKKAGYPIESNTPLPDIKPAFVSNDRVKQMMDAAGASQCKDAKGAPAIMIIDFRNPKELEQVRPEFQIDTQCRTLHLRLDDLLKPDVRDQIPKHGKVISVTEAGNRDIYVQRYLSIYGFKNIIGLQSGMRGWLKKGYPVR